MKTLAMSSSRRMIHVVMRRGMLMRLSGDDGSQRCEFYSLGKTEALPRGSSVWNEL